MSESLRLIEVCAECDMACCAQGEFMCDAARHADTKKLTIGTLSKMPKREHEQYWSKAKLLAVYGDEAPFGYEESK